LGDAFECELLGICDKFKTGGKQSCLLLAAVAVAVIPNMLFMLSVCL
jgi:hypothetical protein